MIRAALLLVAACAETPGPTLAAVEPRSAVAGATVMITGDGLCGADNDCERAGGAIRIGYDTPVQAIVVEYAAQATRIRIPLITPAGKTVLVATVNDRASNALDFEVLAP